MRTCLALSVLLAASGCQCGATRLVKVPEPEDAGPVPAEVVVDAGVAPDAGPLMESPAPDAGQVCTVGAVSGRVCAPDQRTWVNGATVSVTGTDCNGATFTLTTASSADGSFSLAQVPSGARTVHAELGAFSEDTAVQVSAGQTTVVPDNQLCVAQKATKIAVVTGAGDQIEQLLGGLNLQFDRYYGDASNWSASAAAFLSDLSRLRQYDIVFIDCGAGKRSGSSTIDLGASAATISSNLAAYVQGGGSVYASDWSLVFPALAFPGKVTWSLNSASAVANPFNAKQLMGYAPQTVSATITDPALAAFVGKATMPVAFPAQAGAQSLHWGLISGVGSGVDVLLQAPSVATCSTSSTACSSQGSAATQVPLAVRFKLTPASQKGGLVVYTSFHNAGQPTDDVSKVLKYLVLSL